MEFNLIFEFDAVHYAGPANDNHKLCACIALINVYLRLKHLFVLAHTYPYNYDRILQLNAKPALLRKHHNPPRALVPQLGCASAQSFPNGTKPNTYLPSRTSVFAPYSNLVVAFRGSATMDWYS